MIKGWHRYSFSSSRPTQREETVGSKRNRGWEKRAARNKLLNTDMCAQIRSKQCIDGIYIIHVILIKSMHKLPQNWSCWMLEKIIKCENICEWQHFPTEAAKSINRRYTQMSRYDKTSIHKVCQRTEQKPGKQNQLFFTFSMKLALKHTRRTSSHYHWQ